MAVTPTGIESLPLAKLRVSLANSGTFRMWTGTANPTQALGKIHFIGSAAPKSLPRPYAMVGYTENGFRLTKIGAGDDNAYTVAGEIALLLFASINVEDSIPDQVLAFSNKTGAILAEICGLTGNIADRFDFESVSGSGPQLCNEDEHSDEVKYCEATYVFSYEGAPIT